MIVPLKAKDPTKYSCVHTHVAGRYIKNDVIPHPQTVCSGERIYMQRHMGRDLVALDRARYGARALLMEAGEYLFPVNYMVEAAMRWV